MEWLTSLLLWLLLLQVPAADLHLHHEYCQASQHLPVPDCWWFSLQPGLLQVDSLLFYPVRSGTRLLLHRPETTIRT